MNKNFKFRVWDNCISAFMIEERPFVFVQRKGYYLENMSEILNNPSRFKVQQFIGLSDLNEREIYKGDIIIYSIKGEEHVRLKGVVCYDAGSACFVAKWDSDYGYDSFFHDICMVVVIGNICENQDLLNKKRRVK